MSVEKPEDFNPETAEYVGALTLSELAETALAFEQFIQNPDEIPQVEIDALAAKNNKLTGGSQVAQMDRHHALSGGSGAAMHMAGHAAVQKESEGDNNARSRAAIATEIALQAISAANQRFLDQQANYLNSMFDRTDLTDEEKLREYERKREEMIDRLMEDEGLSREDAEARADQELAESGAKSRYDELKAEVAARTMNNVAALKGGINEGKIVSGNSTDYLNSQQKLLNDLRALEVEEGPSEELTNLIEQQEAAVTVADFMVQLEQQGYDPANMSLHELAGRMPPHVNDAYITSMGGQEAYNELLQQELTIEELQKLQSLEQAVDEAVGELSDYRSTLEDANVAKVSIDQIPEELHNGGMDLYNIKEFYVFEDGNGGYELRGVNWTDDMTSVSVTAENAPELFTELKNMDNVGTAAQSVEYIGHANALTGAQLMQQFENDPSSLMPNLDGLEEETSEPVASAPKANNSIAATALGDNPPFEGQPNMYSAFANAAADPSQAPTPTTPAPDPEMRMQA